MDGIATLRGEPQIQSAQPKRNILPEENKGFGFVFKASTNMDPKAPADRVAFVRLPRAIFTPRMKKLTHVAIQKKSVCDNL